MAPILTSASWTAPMPPRSTETNSAAPSKARSGKAMTSASAATALTAAALQPDDPQAPNLGLGHHGVGGGAGDHEDRHGGRMIGAFDERQPGDDFRRGGEFERRPPRAGAGDGEGRERGRDRLSIR